MFPSTLFFFLNFLVHRGEYVPPSAGISLFPSAAGADPLRHWDGDFDPICMMAGIRGVFLRAFFC